MQRRRGCMQRDDLLRGVWGPAGPRMVHSSGEVSPNGQWSSTSVHWVHIAWEGSSVRNGNVAAVARGWRVSDSCESCQI